MHDGQGRRPLVPCTRENGDQLSQAAGNPGSGSPGEVVRGSVVTDWSSVTQVILAV